MKFLIHIKSRGKDYWYFRFKDKRYPVRGHPFQPSFMQEYEKLLGQFYESPTPVIGTIESIVREYLSSPSYSRLAKKTRANYRKYFDIIREGAGKYNASVIERHDVLRLRDTYADKPGIANGLMTAFSSLMSFALDRGYIKINPCAKISRFKLGEFQPWPSNVIQEVLEQASSTLRLAILLHLYTGQRISDVTRMTWNDIENNAIRVKQQKTQKELWIPLHKELADALSSAPKRSVTILTNDRGAAMTPDALRDRLRRLTAYNFHGLRKNAVNALLESGCSEYEAMAITGQSPEILRHYAKGVNQKVLALRAMKKLERKKNEKEQK